MLHIIRRIIYTFIFISCMTPSAWASLSTSGPPRLPCPPLALRGFPVHLWPSDHAARSAPSVPCRQGRPRQADPFFIHCRPSPACRPDRNVGPARARATQCGTRGQTGFLTTGGFRAGLSWSWELYWRTPTAFGRLTSRTKSRH